MSYYYGECLACHKHVRNGHGYIGAYTLCPPCCVTHNKCTSCANEKADLDPQFQVDGQPMSRQVPA